LLYGEGERAFIRLQVGLSPSSMTNQKILLILDRRSY
jgi:hypothetical protein